MAGDMPRNFKNRRECRIDIGLTFELLGSPKLEELGFPPEYLQLQEGHPSFFTHSQSCVEFPTNELTLPLHQQH